MTSPLVGEVFEFLRGLVYRQSGIHVTPKEAGVLATRVKRRLADLRLSSAEEYAAFLRTPEGEREVPALIDAVTTNFTYFFRDPEHFRTLCADALPRVLARKSRSGTRSLLAWCAGCSTGEESYSLAISLAESLSPSDGWSARILATDINRRVLRVAARGAYPRSRFAKLPQEYHYRYLVRDAETPEGWLRVCDEIRSMVAYRRQNILKEVPSFHERFDFIFCRNVMIYFDPPTQAALLRYFQKCLVRGGYLFVSPREVVPALPDGLEPGGPLVYRKL